MFPAESRVFTAVCSDRKCNSMLYLSSNEKIVECFECGQKHNKSSLQDLREVPQADASRVIQNYLFRIVIDKTVPKRGPEMVKVLGLSNYYCKLLSPLLTRYGMDKSTGRAKLLTEMNQGDIFDCSLFGDRAFLIDPEHISIPGFGRDITGSANYLSETMKIIVASNGGEERLIPVHADGDGHCLVHAISRALVGRELFWHPLRCCLKRHFENNLDKYKELFKDFIDADEWPAIIDECDPNFQPPDGELHGLRNIHIFGLANVLKRPIILLDSLECMQKCGDYSALFLPGFVSPEDCRGKDNALNKPLCIAWSSYSHNHYIPLVGVQGKLPPVLPSVLIPKAWGMPQNQIYSYIEFDENKNCVVGGSRSLSNEYIQRLVHAMEVLFYEKNGIHPSLVADAKHFLYPDNILFSVKPAAVLERTRMAVQEGRLYRCLICRSLCELNAEEKYLSNNSAACSQYFQNYKRNQQDSSISSSGLILTYDSNGGFTLGYVPEIQKCTFCNCTSTLRKVTNDGTVIYKPEDKDTRDRNKWLYQDPKRYDDEESFGNKPTKDVKSRKTILKLQWKGKEIIEEITCCDFSGNSKESINEFVKEITKKLVDKYFSDISSDKELQAYISAEIWKILQENDSQIVSERISSKPLKQEFNKQDTAKAMKLDNSSKSSTQSKPPSEIQYIKVVSEKGQQANFALNEEGISYGQLQEWIRNEFNIPPANQVIKSGFPPRPIKAFGDTNKQILSDLKHGDRLLVETKKKDENASPFTSQYKAISSSSSSGFVPEKKEKKALKASNTPMDWDKLKFHPEYFRCNGCIYEKIAAKHKLTYDLHVTLDEYPQKVFCYNEDNDTIELCVHPYGHFLISSSIESEIKEVKQGIPVLFHNPCPLTEKPDKSEDLDDCVSFLRTALSGDGSSRGSLRRMGPGFSVLSPPEDMNTS